MILAQQGTREGRSAVDLIGDIDFVGYDDRNGFAGYMRWLSRRFDHRGLSVEKMMPVDMKEYPDLWQHRFEAGAAESVQEYACYEPDYYS